MGVRWEPLPSPAALELVAAATEQAEPGRDASSELLCHLVSQKKASLALASDKASPPCAPPTSAPSSLEQSRILQAGFWWQTGALSTSHALVFVGADRKEKWRRDPTNQLPACSKSHESVPRAEGTWLSRAKGTLCPDRAGGGTRMLPSQRTCEAREVNRLSAALSGMNVPGLYRPSPDVTGRGTVVPASLQNLRGATLMGICRILLGKA